MANDDADGGVHESVTANMRALAMLVMQVGERVAKTWADLARDAQQRSVAESRLLAARIEAERTAAVATLAVVDRPEWWASTNEQEVAQVLETAATWRDHDPVAARAMDTIDREVRDRYGVALETLQQRAQAGENRAEAVEALAAADVLDRAAGEIAYDSAERREAFAAALRQSTEPDLVAGRVRSDVNFAYPAEQAVSVRGATSVTRGRSGAAPERSQHRPGRTR